MSLPTLSDQSTADAPAPPPELSPHVILLQEIDDIHAVLLTHAQHTPATTATTSRERAERVSMLTWIGAVIGLVLLKVIDVNVWVSLTIALLALVLVGISSFIAVTSFWQEWRQRRAETLLSLTAATTRERELVKELLPFSRAALLHVAASARAADIRVGIRLSFFLGSNRAGGVLGALVLVLGIFSAGKYLQDNRVDVPFLDSPITADHVVLIGAGLLLMTLALLVAGASVASLSSVADLLERVAALKKHLEDEEGRT
ncbi:hypothetical protein HNQ07_004103 [Deinococcus metalli]|uniref:Uncharacterized protein n=1 Tax=Deinococcus metalli TaxID=1141878 RepID=A0A7W8KI47_9DEIO|nr:hypothetical protein [Deinococcus metalli]MBB5378596.1 hypothetical protein [Deinococcus metalli]GHF61033.1 hypothetical protein GCM10017781_41450 [Deinococcus metalli]